jgi:hypothetical protein
LRVEKVQDIWSKLCFELISTGIPTFLHLLHARVVSRSLESEGAPEGATETRLLWALYVRHCVRVGCDQSWTELAALLSLPFQYVSLFAWIRIRLTNPPAVILGL